VTTDGHEAEPFLLGEPSFAAAAALVRATHPVADVGAAVAAAEAAVADIRDPSTPAYLLAQAALGRAYYLAGRAEDAVAPLEAAIQAPLAPRQVVGTSRALATLALVCLDLGEEARAGDLVRRAVQLCEERNLASGPSAWLTYLALATVLVREGRLDQAEAVVAHSVEPQLGWLRHWPLFSAMALLGIAAVRAARDHGRAAHSVLDEARAVLEGCADPGMLPLQLTTIERRLQRQSRPRTTGLTEDLTEGELRVLRLLASDLSQREIGRELYVSVNTVKAHLRSIYRKLDVTRRREAVVRARERSLI